MSSKKMNEALKNVLSEKVVKAVRRLHVVCVEASHIIQAASLAV